MEVTLEFENGNKTKFFNVVKFKPEEEAKKMNFSEAVEVLKIGDKVRRLGWDHNLHVTLFSNCSAEIPRGDEDALVFVDGNVHNHGWVPRIKDIEATDWWIVT